MTYSQKFRTLRSIAFRLRELAGQEPDARRKALLLRLARDTEAIIKGKVNVQSPPDSAV
jgi:hypothetical protein